MLWLCLFCRATVIERDNVWFKDDGALTREFCEDSRFNFKLFFEIFVLNFLLKVWHFVRRQLLC